MASEFLSHILSSPFIMISKSAAVYSIFGIISHKTEIMIFFPEDLIRLESKVIM